MGLLNISCVVTLTKWNGLVWHAGARGFLLAGVTGVAFTLAKLGQLGPTKNLITISAEWVANGCPQKLIETSSVQMKYLHPCIGPSSRSGSSPPV